MDRVTLFIQENLNGYNLPQHTLSEIRGILCRRFRAKFSEGLSPEGRLAMVQAAEREVESAKSSLRIRESTAKQETNGNITNDQHEKKKSKTISFTDTYDKTYISRLAGDITDDNFNEMDLKKRAIGGKIENAFETIETMVHCEVETNQNTTDVDPTKLQSVEKCIVWMEVHNGAPTPSIPDSEYSRNTLHDENNIDEI